MPRILPTKLAMSSINTIQPNASSSIGIANISTPKSRMRNMPPGVSPPAGRNSHTIFPTPNNMVPARASWRRPSRLQWHLRRCQSRAADLQVTAKLGAAEKKSDEPSLAVVEGRQSVAAAEEATRPLKIAIVGFGNFGQFIAKGIKRQGHHDVLATSRSDYSDYCRQHGIRFFKGVSEMCEEDPDVVLVCSSILSTESVVRAIPTHKLSPDTVFADVLSVKQFPRNLFLEVLPAEFGVVCTHPMFGPESGKHGWAQLPFVYDKVRISNSVQARKCDQFLGIFRREGCRMVEMSSEEHDRHAAGSQFITHTIGRILSHIDLESTPINTKGYETLLQLTENTVSDSFDLYYGLFMYNVNATEQIENLDRAFETVKQKLFGRLHDILRKQIVGREPAANSTGRSSTVPLFVPSNGMIKDLSSFGDPTSPQVALQPRRAHREEEAAAAAAAATTKARTGGRVNQQ